MRYNYILLPLLVASFCAAQVVNPGSSGSGGVTGATGPTGPATYSAPVAVTGTKTLAGTDSYVPQEASGTFTISAPASLGGLTGDCWVIRNTGSGTITVSGNGNSILSNGSTVSSIILGPSAAPSPSIALCVDAAGTGLTASGFGLVGATGATGPTGVTGATGATGSVGSAYALFQNSFSGGGLQIGANTTEYLALQGTLSPYPTLAYRQWYSPTAGAIKNFCVYYFGDAQPAGGSLVYSIRQNSTDQLSITLAAGATPASTAPTPVCAAGTITLAAGDLITVKAVNNSASGASATILSFSGLITNQ